MDKIKKTFATKAEADETARTVTARISTEVVDRDGDVMVADGMNAKDFLKNPVVFYNHIYDVPIAQARSLKKGNNEVVAVTEFPERPESHVGEWFPDTVLSLFAAKVLRGFSIGFDHVNATIRRATKSDIERYGDGAKNIISKWTLLEYSVACLPCNQDALALAVNKSIITKGRALELFPDAQIEAPKKKTIVFLSESPKRKTRPRGKSVAEHAVLAIRKKRGEVYE